jgi:bifunctional DNA-binding transcriptional regulator/antitoxin component of YhaV-PrlF toxin-antitoxin module
MPTNCHGTHDRQVRRFVLHKKLREHLGVGPGLKIEATETGEGITLKPIRRQSGLIRKNGILIHGGGLSGDNAHIDWDNLVRDEREERIRKIAGE